MFKAVPSRRMGIKVMGILLLAHSIGNVSGMYAQEVAVAGAIIVSIQHLARNGCEKRLAVDRRTTKDSSSQELDHTATHHALWAVGNGGSVFRRCRACSRNAASSIDGFESLLPVQ